MTNDITDEDVKDAIAILQRFKVQETDDDHKDSIESIQRMLAGVFEIGREPPTVDELERVEEVLKAVDPEEQWWHGEGYVEDEVERGLSWVEEGKKYAENPRMWQDDN